MLDYFLYYLFPMALKIGMTPEQFWEDDPDLMGAYLEAYRMKEEERVVNENYFMWLQGQYQMMAMAQVFQFTKSPKKIYPKKPFNIGKDKSEPMTQKDYEKIRKIQMQNMVERFKQEQ